MPWINVMTSLSCVCFSVAYLIPPTDSPPCQSHRSLCQSSSHCQPWFLVELCSARPPLVPETFSLWPWPLVKNSSHNNCAYFFLEAATIEKIPPGPSRGRAQWSSIALLLTNNHSYVWKQAVPQNMLAPCVILNTIVLLTLLDTVNTHLFRTYTIFIAHTNCAVQLR